MSNELRQEIGRLRPGEHLCLLYESAEEQLRAAVPFVRDGIERGERCLYIVDDRTADEVTTALARDGVDVAAALASGSLVLLTKRETYLRGGRFEPDAMLALIDEVWARAMADGHPRLRLTGEMTWALGPDCDSDRLVEYEARLNDLLARRGILTVCQYSRRRFAPEVIEQMLRTHPVAVVGGKVCPNPYYEPAELLLSSGRPERKVDWMIGQLEQARTSARALDRSRQQFEALVENAPDVISRFDRALRHVYINPAIEEATGIERSVFLGRGYDELGMRGEVAARWRAALTLAFAGEPATFEFDFPSPDGTRHYHTRIVPERAPDGAVESVLSIARDVTERHRTLEAQLRLAAVVESSNDAIIGKTLDGIITSWNASAARIYGYAAEEVIGRHVSMLSAPGHEDEMERQVERIRRAERVAHFETVRRRKDGALIHVSQSVSPVVDASGRTVGVSVIARDVTERVQAEAARRGLEEQLRQSQKIEAIGRLAGGIAHDFNNLLTVIQSSCSFLLEGLGAADPLRADAEEIFRASERAVEMTRQLLAVSRRQVIEPRLLDVDAVVRDMERMLRRLIGEDVELVTDPGARGGVVADRGQLEQVVVNLVVNGRDAMPRGGRIDVRTRDVALTADDPARPASLPPGAYVSLCVSDTGVGIPQSVRVRVFEPFFTTKENGTGLGLATVHDIVRRAGGAVVVDSEEGRGTTFRLYFPRAAEARPAETPVERDAAGPRGSETVLLVEDEEAVRSLARRSLERSGYTVLAANGGAEALRLSAAHPSPIHLLVTDAVMPGMSGREVADALRASRSEMRVLYVSGYSGTPLTRHGVPGEGFAFLEKPFTPEGLARKVREVLG